MMAFASSRWLYKFMQLFALLAPAVGTGVGSVKDELDEESQFHLNCTNLTIEQLKHINLTRSITAMVCVVIVAIILMLLVIYKAYSSTLQRLFLYLMVATLFSESIQAMGIEHQWKYGIQETFCTWLAFVTHWTSVMVFLSALGMILYLLFMVYSQVRGSLCPRITLSKCLTRTLEVLYALFPVVLSLAFALEPYIEGTYGLAGPWCWIRSVDEDCKSVGMRDQMIYFGLYELVGVIGIFSTLGFAIVYCRLAAIFREARRLLRQTLILMGFLLAYILIVTLQLCVRLYTGLTHHQQHYGMWLMHAVIIPLGQLTFPLGCLVCYYSFEKLGRKGHKWCGFTKCFKSRSHSRTKSRNCSVHWATQQPELTRDTTVHESKWVSQPSSTYFHVPYTNEFTNITNNTTPTENSPLIPCPDVNDTGYSSITCTVSDVPK